jgi:hypothetical protein
LEYLKRTDHLERKGVDGRRILKWILNKVRECEPDSFGSGQRPVEGARQHANVYSFLYHLCNYLLLTMDYHS